MILSGVSSPEIAMIFSSSKFYFLEILILLEDELFYLSESGFNFLNQGHSKHVLKWCTTLGHFLSSVTMCPATIQQYLPKFDVKAGHCALTSFWQFQNSQQF